MTTSRRPFRYVLEPILKKNNWDIDVLRLEAARAEGVVAQRRAEKDVLHKTIGELENELRQVQTQNSAIARDKYERMMAFLEHARKLSEEKQQQIEQAEKVHVQIVTQMRNLKLSTKGLENHKQRKRKAHQTEQERAQMLEADETWLISKRKPRS